MTKQPSMPDAIRERHAVRRYQDRPIEADKVGRIQSLIDDCNRDSGLHIQLVTNEPLAFSTGVFKYGQFIKLYPIENSDNKGVWLSNKVFWWAIGIVEVAVCLATYFGGNAL